MDIHALLLQTHLLRASDGQAASVLQDKLQDKDNAKATLVLVWPQLGDFDTLEYAGWIARDRPKLEAANIQVRAVGIGDDEAIKAAPLPALKGEVFKRAFLNDSPNL